MDSRWIMDERVGNEFERQSTPSTTESTPASTSNRIRVECGHVSVGVAVGTRATKGCFHAGGGGGDCGDYGSGSCSLQRCLDSRS